MTEVIPQVTRSILVVEDELDIREILFEFFSQSHWKVHFALTNEAIREVVSQVAGVVYEWDCLEIDRDEALKLFSEKPLFVMAADLDCPYEGFIQKPFDPNSLVEKVNEACLKFPFFVDDTVQSRVTPDYGVGKVITILDKEHFEVFFPEKDDVRIKCHASVLKLMNQ